MESSTEELPCSRRARHYVPHSQRCKLSVTKRNARERKRMLELKEGFQSLKNRVPIVRHLVKRVSKEKVLKYAIEYIQLLKMLLGRKVPHKDSVEFWQRANAFMNDSPQLGTLQSLQYFIHTSNNYHQECTLMNTKNTSGEEAKSQTSEYKHFTVNSSDNQRDVTNSSPDISGVRVRQEWDNCASTGANKSVFRIDNTCASTKACTTAFRKMDNCAFTITRKAAIGTDINCASTTAHTPAFRMDNCVSTTAPTPVFRMDNCVSTTANKPAFRMGNYCSSTITNKATLNRTDINCVSSTAHGPAFRMNNCSSTCAANNSAFRMDNNSAYTTAPKPAFREENTCVSTTASKPVFRMNNCASTCAANKSAFRMDNNAPKPAFREDNNRASTRVHTPAFRVDNHVSTTATKPAFRLGNNSVTTAANKLYSRLDVTTSHSKLHYKQGNEQMCVDGRYQNSQQQQQQQQQQELDMFLSLNSLEGDQLYEHQQFYAGLDPIECFPDIDWNDIIQ